MDAPISDYGSVSCDHVDDHEDKRENRSFLPRRGGFNNEESGWTHKSFTSLLLLLAFALSASSAMGRYYSTSSPMNPVLSSPNTSKSDIQKVVYIIRHGEKVRDPSNETAYKYACLSDRGRARAHHLAKTFAGGRDDGHPAGRLVAPAALFSFNYDNGDLDCLDPSDDIYRTEATLRPLSERVGIPIDNRHGAKPDLCGLGAIDDTPGITDQETNLVHYNHEVCHHPSVTGSVHDFGMCCNVGAAEAIRAKLFEEAATTSAVLVAWEHANIGYLAEALMIDDKDGAIGTRDLDVAAFVSTSPALRDIMYWPDASFDAVWALWFDPETQNFVRIDTEMYAQGFDES